MLQQLLDDYLARFPEERVKLASLLKQIADDEKMNDRRNFHGHITGSGILLSPDRSKILLIHHKLFNRWQQPGGHWESDEESDPLEAARRESIEEAGIEIADYLAVDPANQLVPIDIDSHEVPARPEKDEPEHWHHDFRYIFVAKSEKLTHQEAEVSGAKWFPLDAPEIERIAKPVAKLRRFGFITK